MHCTILHVPAPAPAPECSFARAHAPLRTISDLSSLSLRSSVRTHAMTRPSLSSPSSPRPFSLSPSTAQLSSEALGLRPRHRMPGAHNAAHVDSAPPLLSPPRSSLPSFSTPVPHMLLVLRLPHILTDIVPILTCAHALTRRNVLVANRVPRTDSTCTSAPGQ